MPGTVPRDVVDGILEAANWAPTHGKTEPWRFVVAGKSGIDEVQTIKREHEENRLKDDPEALEAFKSKFNKKAPTGT